MKVLVNLFLVKLARPYAGGILVDLFTGLLFSPVIPVRSVVEAMGLEPTTSALRTQRSPS